eukprot:GFUD01013591.1.p1 GENE.GFUD01013591.1~~GFUD01013591.1.p1  ORF type:complete len:151 (+),score=64.94 GFUD01013591.1:132-584(+)
MAVIEEAREGEENLDKYFEGVEKLVKLDANTDLEQLEEFFKDSDDDEGVVDGPTEAEEIMLKEDIAKFKEGVKKEREKYQPTAAEKIFAVMKSIILRALAFYLIMWLFKRNSTPGGIPRGGGVPPVDDFEDVKEDLATPAPELALTVDEL